MPVFLAMRSKIRAEFERRRRDPGATPARRPGGAREKVRGVCKVVFSVLPTTQLVTGLLSVYHCHYCIVVPMFLLSFPLFSPLFHCTFIGVCCNE